MTLSIKKQREAERETKGNTWKKGLAVLLGIFPCVFFFLPGLHFVFRNTSYLVSGLQLVTASGLRVQGPTLSGLVTIPLLAKIAVVGGVVLSVAGIILLLRGKAAYAGGSFILSGVTPLFVLISVSSIQSAVASLNISQITVSFLWPCIGVFVCGLFSAVLSLWTQGTEKLAESVFLVSACVSVAGVLLITIYVFATGAPAIAEIGLGPFLFGAVWNAGRNQFGILALILSSISATFGSIVLGVPVGILTAVFLAETAPPFIARLVRPAVELLAGIPSVVYGFFGMLVIVPAIRDFPLFRGRTIGDSLLAAVLILAIMILPTIVSVTETSLRAVPQAYREASLALGATPTATIFKVTIPAAKSGILAGVILGVGRAIGETMAVVMVAGNVANMPSLLGTVRLLTTGIAMEMSYASGLHREALFAIGLILFIFIMIVNISFTIISKQGVQMDEK
ncbi:Phosphate transport system permease protein [Ruminococcaceae bacterium BL-6]|nr:Phosphate transport system permease protein [Ruminococcaceae bacterium BL-6]